MDKKKIPTKVAGMSKACDNFTTDTLKGTISINESVLISIVKNTAEQIPGIIRLTSAGKFAETMAFMIGRTKSKPDSVQIKLSEDELTVSIRIVAAYGYNIPELGLKLQMAISHAIKEMAQIEATNIDVFVENVEQEETNEPLVNNLELIV